MTGGFEMMHEDALLPRLRSAPSWPSRRRPGAAAPWRRVRRTAPRPSRRRRAAGRVPAAAGHGRRLFRRRRCAGRRARVLSAGRPRRRPRHARVRPGAGPRRNPPDRAAGLGARRLGRRSAGARPTPGRRGVRRGAARSPAAVQTSVGADAGGDRQRRPHAADRLAARVAAGRGGPPPGDRSRARAVGRRRQRGRRSRAGAGRLRRARRWPRQSGPVPVIDVETVPAGRRAQARQLAEKLAHAGLVPWVRIGDGGWAWARSKPVPRRILVVQDGAEEPNLAATSRAPPAGGSARVPGLRRRLRRRARRAARRRPDGALRGGGDLVHRRRPGRRRSLRKVARAIRSIRA